MKNNIAKKLVLLLVSLSVSLWLPFLHPVVAIGAQTDFTLWPAATLPGIADSGPDSSVELGVKFHADTGGFVTGIRFYKAQANTGIHTGSLWTNTGTLLASATFTNETASGWQQVDFSAPVAIAANTVYVASYHTDTGHYSYNQYYFSSAGVDSPPLHAPAATASLINGMYSYGSGSSFPEQGWRSSNYWVDVVFSAAASPDTEVPIVTTFTIPPESTSLTVPVESFSATDNVSVSGYLINEQADAPVLTDPGWSAEPPGSYTFSSGGSKTLYAWARDAAGNVSAGARADVSVSVEAAGPEPSGWYAGDMHLHRSCGGTPQELTDVYQKMIPNDLTFVSVLADMGNGEVKDPQLDLPRVTGQDDPVSTAERVMHWDAEWHWDPTYYQYPHQALGGHVLALGLTEAHQIWEEYTYPIFSWAHEQNGIAGFAHMQYLPAGIPESLNCCIPLEYPVEVALGAADFISMDVVNNTNAPATMSVDNAINAYYRLLNCGFHPGLAAGTDYPCNDGQTVGSPLTYASITEGEVTYRNWIEGIARGRTVISMNGHEEFLELTVNGSAGPGDEVRLTGGGSVPVEIKWTARQNLTGIIELVQNGVVVATAQASAVPGTPAILTATVNFANSGWLAARRMGSNGFQVHTAAVVVTVNGAPVRASAADAQFYVEWMDNLLARTAPGGDWNSYFVNSGATARARYQTAKDIFQQIALEAASTPSTPTITTLSLPDGSQGDSYSANLTATGGTLPYMWSLAGGSLPAGLFLDGTTGGISGIPATDGTASFTVRVTDSGTPPQTATIPLTITVSPRPSYTIWPETTVPGLVDGGPDTAVELGLKFRSDVDGYITGIRFYKAATNGGTHTGNLWNSNGTLLATATFSGETASGWQQVNFPSPVAISAGTVYVASYHVAAGHYSADSNYFTGSGTDSPPLHALASGISGANGVFAYGSDSTFPTQSWNNANYWVDVAFSATPPATLASLTVTPADVIIANGATQQFTATGTYSDGSSRNVTGQAAWTSSNPVVATITAAGGLATGINAGTSTITALVNGISGNAQLTVPVSPLAITANPLPGAIVNYPYEGLLHATGGTLPYAWTIDSGTLPAGLILDGTTGGIGGTPATAGTSSFTVRVTDSATPPQTASLPLTITVITKSSYTIWPETTVPGLVDGGPDTAVELGLKFRSDVDGYITGIRFYKAATNGGTHTGNLWNSNGTLLATATFSGETASGWQQVNFPSPVAISAGTVYVASYHVAAGHYSADSNYFTGSGTDSPPLHALASGVSGANGIFAYGSGSTFPTQSWNSANYWVDVAFSTSSQHDTTPPVVTAFIVPATASSLTVAITGFDATDNVAVTGYLVTEAATVPPLSADGWSATAPVSYTFTTTGTKTLHAWARDDTGNVSACASAVVTLSSEGPILLVSSPLNPFSGYYAEIIRTEGLNAFAETDVSLLTAELLAAHDVVILGEIPLTTGQVTLLGDWVAAGGKLIAMRPDKKLAPLLGLNDQGTTLANAYLLVDTASGPGEGIANQTMQYHGTADRYGLDGATSLATLYGDDDTPTASPAVTMHSVGTNGGLAAAFTYDLARSVIYSRQGNPAWSGQERDGNAPIRSNDLFYGAASQDPQPDWIDLDKVAIPQADEQQRLLANLVIRMNRETRPLPRFWYFPRNLPAVVVMTGDDHGFNGTAGRFETYLDASPPGCSVDNWECIRSTSYIFTNSLLDDGLAAAYNAAGFEVGLHVNTKCADWTPSGLESFYAAQISDWRGVYGSLPPQRTNRTHCIAWSDYATQPEVELAHGIRLDSSYYYYPSTWVADRPGFFTGSGMPMRFTDSGGNLIDVYQATTQMTDESGQTFPFTVNTLLDNAIGPDGYYGAFVANMHTDEVASSGSDSIVASAVARGIPVISARQLLTWLDGRNASTFGSLQWNGTVLNFTISVANTATGLTAMVPVVDGQTVTEIRRDGSPVSFAIVKIKGIQYARFAALDGAYRVAYATDTTAPVVGGVLPLQGASDVSTLPKVSVTFSEVIDPATVTNGTFEVRDPSGVPVPATVTYHSTTHTATLEPVVQLAGLTNYTAIVRGGADGIRDLAGNPLASDFSWSFGTTVAISGTFSLWSASATPEVIDEGPDNPVELGVMFRSDVNGYVAGIRFYKASTNIGPHIGNLWTESGVLLATALFTNESASGWQEVIFADPVAISANTDYVVSYHTSAGHYSDDVNYFATRGVDSPPLHALANGVAGFNGLYAYGPGSNFPNQGWNSSNYWVDVIFSAAELPTLSSITVTPGNQRIAIGASQQFTATGTYSDGSTRNLTSQVIWSSGNSGVGTITANGVVTAVSLGVTTISADLNGIIGSTNMTATDQIGFVSRGMEETGNIVD